MMKNSTTSTSRLASHVLCLVFMCGSLNIVAQNNNLNFSKVPLSFSFSAFDYAGGIQNWDIVRDERGIIYIANNFGLLEFDGKYWNLHTVPQSTRTLSLLVSQDKRIYTGGQNQFGYFYSNESGELVYKSLSDLIAGKEEEKEITNVWKVLEYEGAIYFNTDDGIYEYRKNNEVTFYNFGGGIGSAFNTQNGIYAFTNKDGMMKFTGNSFSKVSGGEVFKDKTVSGVVNHENIGLLIFQSDGTIYTLQNEQLTLWPNKVSKHLQNSFINDVLLLSNETIAIGTQNNGLFLMDLQGNPINHIDKEKGLNSVTVRSIHEDQYQNLWLGLNNGISVLELGSPFSMINNSVGISGTGYAAYLSRNTLFLGTNTGLYRQESNADIFSQEQNGFERIPGSEGQVYHIQELENSLMIGHHEGAMELKSGKMEPVIAGTGVWKFLRSPSSGNILVGTYLGFKTIQPNGTILDVKGFNESARVFEAINDSTLWLTHSYRGTYRVSFNKELTRIKQVDFYGDKKGFPSNLLINVFKVDEELVFPAEYGVYNYNPNQQLFVNHAALEELLGAYNHVSQLQQDTEGNLYYMIDNNQFGMLKHDAFNGFEKVENSFRRINKFLSDDLENISIIDPENVIIGAKDGFIHYNPSIERSRPSNFPVYIREISITGDADSTLFQGGSQPRLTESLSPESNSLLFKFASPYFDGVEDIEYQYMLENFDENWSEWDASAFKEYTNLPGGEYIFMVKARNIYGDVSSIASVSFSISPPWYLSKAAYVSYFFLFICLFGLSLFLLDKKHRDDKRRIEINSEKMILEKDQELKTISQINSETIEQLKNEKLKVEVEFKNRELTTSTMHLVNKNEVMLSIKNDLETYMKQDSGNVRAIKRIIKTIDSNIAEDENWEQFTRHFDQVHGDFLKRLKKEHPDLTPQETKLSAYLRMNLTSKNIAQLNNISVRGVEVSRYRLRKKLDLDRDTNLVNYLSDM